jgi:hypothetical protein
MGNQLTGSTTINDGTWHFLMATRNDSIARLYVDGRVDASQNSPAQLSYCGHNPSNFYWAGSFIGAAYRPMASPSSGYYPTCYLDELMLENYAISPEEALNRYLFWEGVLN